MEGIGGRFFGPHVVDFLGHMWPINLERVEERNSRANKRIELESTPPCPSLRVSLSPDLAHRNHSLLGNGCTITVIIW